MHSDNELTIALHAIRHQKIGGTESAIYNLVKGIYETQSSVTVAYSDPSRLSPDFAQWIEKHRDISIRKTGRLPGPKSGRFFEECLFEASRRDDSWVLYPNYFAPPPLFKRRPTAVLLHDVQYKELPQYHSEKRRRWLDFYLPKMFESAQIIFLISEVELEKVRIHFGERAATKCRVIYNAIDFDRFGTRCNVAELRPLTRPYILTVCHHFPHKNIETLLKAFDQIARKVEDVDLYLVGKQSPENLRLINSAVTAKVAKRVRLLGFVSDAELGDYYRNAALFALPSIYEGFGMPAIESIGFEVPTLLSDIPSLREITFGEACYVTDPLSVDEWACRLESMLEAPSQPEYLAKLASRVRSTYQPRKIGARLLQFLYSADIK